MISLNVIFWTLVTLFAVVGFLRGWSKEMVATAGLVLSLFTLKQFGWTLVRLIGAGAAEAGTVDVLAGMRSQFYVLGSIHLGIAFFSYQGVALAAARLSRRDTLQEKLLGMIVGAINGYLIVGGLWSFLEYQVTPEGFVPLQPGFPYAFDPAITRPVLDTPTIQLVVSRLPLPWLGPILPILLVVVFLFVIVVII